MSEGHEVEVSDTALKVWETLTQWPGTYDVTELTSQLHLSKAALNRAMMELEELSLLSTEVEED